MNVTEGDTESVIRMKDEGELTRISGKLEAIISSSDGAAVSTEFVTNAFTVVVKVATASSVVDNSGVLSAVCHLVEADAKIEGKRTIALLSVVSAVPLLAVVGKRILVEIGEEEVVCKENDFEEDVSEKEGTLVAKFEFLSLNAMELAAAESLD